jgi:hypothetical protein
MIQALAESPLPGNHLAGFLSGSIGNLLAQGHCEGSWSKACDQDPVLTIFHRLLTGDADGGAYVLLD